MNIIECHFEFGGFDDHLVKGGISVYLWNLCRQFRAAGHQVTGLTAAHGLIPRLRDRHEITTLGWRASAAIPVRLDPRVWPGFPGQVTLPVSATAHRLRIDGVDIVFLAGGLLDQHTDAFYPPYELKGRDLSFLKPLVFQVIAARFLADVAAPGTIVHLHEPYYHYLIPAALRDRGVVTVSTVQSNMPVSKKVYGPEVRTLLSHLGGDPAVADELADPPLDTPLQRTMRSFLPATLLYNDYPERPGHDYVSVLGLVVRCVHALDFLSPGQLEHAVTQSGTPFEQLFEHLTVRRELLARPGRLVVGGCAIGAAWLDAQRSDERRKKTLTALGLNPALPTVYHNARYAIQHKGQQEMFRALLRVLGSGSGSVTPPTAGERCNVLLHCLAPRPPDDPGLAALMRHHGDLVRVRTGPMAEAELIDWAVASDLCLYPSKFEMDTFLMAMGEAMACGAVPIATAQRGMRHFGHAFDLDDPAATGLALPRSFRADDPVLTDAIAAGLRYLLGLVRTQPDRIETLRARAVAVARRFTWERTADRFLEIFSACAADALPVPEPATFTDRRRVGLLTGRTVQARPQAGQIHIRWGPAAAARVEAVMGGQDPGRPPEIIPLGPQPDGSFCGRVPEPGTGHIALLITSPDGQATWDEVTIAAADA